MSGKASAANSRTHLRELLREPATVVYSIRPAAEELGWTHGVELRKWQNAPNSPTQLITRNADASLRWLNGRWQFCRRPLTTTELAQGHTARNVYGSIETAKLQRGVDYLLTLLEVIGTDYRDKQAVAEAILDLAESERSSTGRVSRLKSDADSPTNTVTAGRWETFASSSYAGLLGHSELITAAESLLSGCDA